MSLPWIKHFTNVSDSDVVSRIIDELGMAGYGRYWRLLELLGRKFDEGTTKFNVSKRELRQYLRFKSYSQLDCFLSAPAIQAACNSLAPGLQASCNSHTSDLYYEIETSILLELQHRDFKRARKDRAKTNTKTNTNTKKQPPAGNSAIDPRIIEVIDYLNQNQACNYGPNTKSHHVEIKRQLKKGMTLEMAKAVIDSKCKEWIGTKLEKNLNPTTLFRESNFDRYFDQADLGDPKERADEKFFALWDFPEEGGSK